MCCILCVLDRASSWYLNKGRSTWWHLLYYVNLLLNMFRMLIHRVVVQPGPGYHITNSQSRYITPTRLKSAQLSLHNNAPSSRKLLKMDVLTSETCWTVNWHNKASVIKLIYLYSNSVLYVFKTISVLTFLKIVPLIVPINCKNFANLNSKSLENW